MSKHSAERAVRVATAATSIVLALSLGAVSGARTYSSYVTTVLGGSPFTIKDTEKANKIYEARGNGMPLSKWKTKADSLVQTVAGEGIVLLKNDANTLPLAKGSKVTLFGRSSTDLVLGGTGAGGIDPDRAVDLNKALTAEGFKVNKTMWNFYQSYKGKPGYIRSNGTYMGTLPKDVHIAEPPVSEYTAAVRQSYDTFADAAIVVFSRVGGEGSDMPTGKFGDGNRYLALQDSEKQVLKEIHDSGKFGKVIALINTSNAMELSWMDQNQYGINASLWAGGLGQSGARAIARILDGTVNPSGRLVDTYASNSFSAPAMQNFGDFTFTNGQAINKRIGPANKGDKYLVYREGIYTGYRYYETRYADSVLDPEGTNANSSSGAFADKTWNYDREVVFPFGYGLSYGNSEGHPFQQQLVSSSADERGATFEVKVTNTGNVSGKDVVQLYAQQPYQRGGIEKSAIQLVGFDKTPVLQPGQSTLVTIKVRARDYSSYDAHTLKTYVLDQGDFYFAIGNNAHQALNNILASRGANPARMDEHGDPGCVHLWHNEKPIKLDKAYSGKVIGNIFQSAGLEHYGKRTGYLTRSDWTTFPKPYNKLKATDAMIHDIDAAGGYQAGDKDTSSITTKAKNGLTFAQMHKARFNDPRWEKLLDQMSVDDLVTLVTRSGQVAIPSISFPAQFMKDGPQGNNVRPYVEDGSKATGYCGEVTDASTFNRSLIHQENEAKAEDWIRTDTAGAYAPAMNIHRTPYSGRNFEYYSEDGYLSGEFAYEAVTGLQKHGVVAFAKHFAMNDQETNRQGVCTFADEQTIREIYLKAFERPFTDGHVKATMGSFNRIGCIWTGAHQKLIKNLVRGEWGSMAIVDTDMAINPILQNAGAGLEAGNTMWATSASTFHDQIVKQAAHDKKMLSNLRQSGHIILYTFVNSNGVNGLSTASRVVKVTPPWLKLAYTVVGLLCVIDLALFITLIRKSRNSAHITIESDN